MKIMHVVESYGGGVFTSVNQLCNGFANQHDVVLVHGLREETPANFAAALHPGVRLIQIPFTREIRPKVDFQSLSTLVRLFKEERPDVIHLHSSKAGFLGRMAAAIAGLRAVVYSPRAFAFLDPANSPLKKRMYRTLEQLGGKLGGIVVGCSGDEADEARAVAPHVAQINNAIDIELLDRIERSAPSSYPARPLTVGVHARVRDAKRPALFQEVARLVQQQHPEVRFLWIGGGDPFFDGCAEVHCTGWLPRNDALATLSREVDIYLLTSAYEGLPLSVIEAAAMGKPSVCTDVSGTHSAVDQGKSGFLCPDNDAGALAQAVLNLVNDVSVRAQTGAYARQFARQEFDLPLMLARYQALYSALVAGSGQQVPHAV